MISLSNIPEPSGTFRPESSDDEAHTVPLASGLAADPPAPSADAEQLQTERQEPQSQLDNLALLLVLLIAGALLRIVLGLLGPMQGISEEAILQSQESGRSALAGDPANAYPLFDLLVIGLSNISAPAWVAVLLGSLLTLAAIPAAYLIGFVTTGRRVPGIVAAAIIAVHPAVLTASNQLSPSAIAMALVLIGLALVCCVGKRGFGYALAGAITLGLAGLAAPLCWLTGLFAGPLTIKLARRRGAGRALVSGLCVVVLSLGPAMGYRGFFLGNNAESFLPEFVQTQQSETLLPPADRLMVTMTQPSFAQLGEALHLPLGEAGRLKVITSETPDPDARRDIVADTLADGWLLLNAAMAGLAAISAGVMLLRRRLIEVAVLAGPFIAMAFCVLPPSEALRLPMVGLVGALALGLFATRSAPLLTDAEREEKRIAKLAKAEEKERVKQERALKQHKEGLYAFDKPTRKDKKRIKRERAQTVDTPQPQVAEGVLTEHEAEAPPLSARPI